MYSGIGLGTALAAIVSYVTNQSILWMLIHAFFGWFYIIYRVIGG